tara:strand:+ start:514 stop:615 length:102 start_codon:yes stop_codon:yes gene_type:complete
MSKSNDKEHIKWDDLSPIDKELLDAFRNGTPEA